MTCHRSFCDRDELEQGKKERILEGDGHGALQKLLLLTQAQCWQRIVILARFPKFCWGLELCQCLLVEMHRFQRIPNLT